ncbi:TPA: hypothetical protein ACONOZ_002664 [Staphylococcus aureus]
MKYNEIFEVHKQIVKENKTMTRTSKGYIYESTYQDYPIKITRGRAYGHLCGYIKMNVLQDSSEYNIIDKIFHGGITFHNDEWVGFDCLHSEDFSLYQYALLSDDFDNCLDGKEYRTLDEVKNCLITAIDTLNEKEKSYTQ